MADVMTDSEKMMAAFNIQPEEELLQPWNREVAEGLARELGIEMSDSHWELVQLVRRHYEEMGAIDYARDLTGMLDQRYKKQGGLRYLYTLFPGGPVTQSCYIAGIRAPKDNASPAFGYSV